MTKITMTLRLLEVALTAALPMHDADFKSSHVDVIKELVAEDLKQIDCLDEDIIKDEVQEILLYHFGEEGLEVFDSLEWDSIEEALQIS